MGFTTVKKIRITKDEVYITGAESNTLPREYKEEKDNRLSNILKTEGRDELDKAILLLYWQGFFKGNTNKYTKAVQRFYKLHPNITWMNTGIRIGEQHGRLIMYDYGYVSSLLLKILKKEDPYGTQ